MKIQMLAALSFLISSPAFSRGMLLTCHSYNTTEVCDRDDICETEYKVNLLTDGEYIHNTEFNTSGNLDVVASKNSFYNKTYDELIQGKKTCLAWEELDSCYHFEGNYLFLLEFKKPAEFNTIDSYYGKIILKENNITTYSEVNCNLSTL